MIWIHCSEKLTDVMPPYLANYLCWYYADPNTRCSWEELCSYDANFKQQGEHAGENKSEQFGKSDSPQHKKLKVWRSMT